MPKICYVPKTFGKSSQQIIGQANSIIEEYAAQGYDLTLRQLYYQFVARDLIQNKQSEYKRLGAIISDARLAGLIDWNRLVDRTRNLQQNSHWTDPGEIIDACASQYRVDRWHGQSTRVEVWVEKDALLGVLERACSALDVSWFSCRGYTSQSEMWRAAQRLVRWNNLGVKVVILHLGDHDPSGLDMSRDIYDRLQVFCVPHYDVERIALTMEQVEEIGPPPNPAKITDSRCAGYIARWGTESWELDALDPRYLGRLIEERTGVHREQELYEKRMEVEAEHRKILQHLAETWQENGGTQ